MHLVFVHQNFPAQFGHIARFLVRELGYQCTFVTNRQGADVDGVRRLYYEPSGGATRHTHYCARTFENAVAHAQGVFQACQSAQLDEPDLVVGHSGFGSTLFLRELFACPIINYFEYYYHPHDSDLDFRPEFPVSELNVLRSYCRNAMLHLDLENCDRGYSPTFWQRSRFPAIYSDKIDVIFDGVDTDVWHRRTDAPREIAGHTIPENTRVVTYVSRGFESMRGFDVFMAVAKKIYTQHPDVIFICVGQDRIAYGGDANFIEGESFREHVFKQGDYDLSRFVFTGLVPPHQLAQILSISDLHIYLTVPFVLSWSLFNALACECTVVASDTAPVQELITHNQTGLLAPFFDIDALADHCHQVLSDPEKFRHLGRSGCDLIQEKYTLARSLPKLVDLYDRTRGAASKDTASTDSAS